MKPSYHFLEVLSIPSMFAGMSANLAWVPCSGLNSLEHRRWISQTDSRSIFVWEGGSFFDNTSNCVRDICRLDLLKRSSPAISISSKRFLAPLPSHPGIFTPVHSGTSSALDTGLSSA
jgi:hypothetical protein